MNISRGDLHQALHRIGENDQAREILLTALRDLEKCLEVRDFDVREEVTGPICDEMFRQTDVLTKQIADGTTFSARYTSKIIRDFMLAGPEPEFMWEPQTSRTLLHLCRGSKNVLIGGAYVGDHAILIAKAIATIAGVVHCFEPSSGSIALLARNAKDNGLQNIVLNNIGLWSSGEKLTLIGKDSHAAPSKAKEGDDYIEATTIDHYCEDNGIDSLDLIQLDVEGGELEVLKGGEQMLSQGELISPHLVFEVHRLYIDWSNGFENSDIITYLRNFGYVSYAIRDYHGNEPFTDPVELIPPGTCYLEGPPHGFNMLAVKDISILESEFFRIVDGVSPKLLKHRDPTLHAPVR